MGNLTGNVTGNSDTSTTATKLSTTAGAQPVYGFRAWAVIKNTGSAFSVLAGNGITSVTFSNAGQTATVNITSANQPSTADYGILVTCASPAGAQGQRYGSVTSRTTSAFSINFSDDSSLNVVDEFTIMVIY